MLVTLFLAIYIHAFNTVDKNQYYFAQLAE